MPRAQDRFLSQLRETFIVEAREHLQTLGDGLMALEKAQDAEARRPLVETVFRAAHSLKGAARSVDLREVEAHCQALEELFSPWKRGQSSPTPVSLDQAHRFLNQLAAAVGAIVPATAPPPPGEPARGQARSARKGRPPGRWRPRPPRAGSGSGAPGRAMPAWARPGRDSTARKGPRAPGNAFRSRAGPPTAPPPSGCAPRGRRSPPAAAAPARPRPSRAP